MIYLHHAPAWLRICFPPSYVWEESKEGQCVYLTFDDGPHPVATPFVLDQLKQFGMKGTFFCIGKNVNRYPELFQQIQAEGHTIGNHTMHHLNAAKVDAMQYIQDVRDAAQLIPTQLFRPPYGRLNWRLAKSITDNFPGFKIIMWSILTGDFDIRVSGEDCFAAFRKHTRPGGIVVWHDSEKAWPRLKEALPLALAYMQEKGWTGCGLSG